MILATFDPLIPKLCSDKSESGGKWILLSHWLRNLKMLGISQWETRIHFPPLSDLSEHSFGISGPNVARISWNFECYQFFILVGPGGNRGLMNKIYSNLNKLTCVKMNYSLFHAYASFRYINKIYIYCLCNIWFIGLYL